MPNSTKTGPLACTLKSVPEARQNPVVSAIIATKGRPDLVVRAIETVLAQTFSSFELIVVIDGPDPETELKIDSIDDPRLKFVVNERNLGCAASRMVGIRAAAGWWIALLDDDDEWLPEKLERQLETVSKYLPQDRDVAVATCLVQVVSPIGNSIRPIRPYDDKLPFDVWLFDRAAIRQGSIFQASSILIPRALALEIEFRAQAAHEDWDFVLRAIAKKNAKIVTSPEVLVRHFRDDLTPRMSNEHQIADSLAWLDSLGNAVSARGYSAFCLSVIASHAADRRQASWFWPLLLRAFRKGAPTARQVLGFLSLWFMTKTFRRRLLGALFDRPRKNLAKPTVSNSV